MEKLNPVIEESWREILQDEFDQPYFYDLKSFLVQERTKYRIFPPGSRIFNAFNLTPFHKVKVVILGQDPYHGAGQAHGLCFSVQDGIARPPSLINIFRELETDCGIPASLNGNLTKWAEQGVLMQHSPSGRTRPDRTRITAGSGLPTGPSGNSPPVARILCLCSGEISPLPNVP